jgi:sodium/potassium/calcium exchanger 6
MYEAFLVDYEALSKRPWLLYCVSGIMTLLWFFSLYIIADDHLNRSLALLAKKCRMSPAMAGLTLLAFGNGASDFFTAVIGVSESPIMILGSSAGAGLFITCVVMGLTIVFAAQDRTDEKVTMEIRKSRDGFAVSRGSFLKSTFVYLACSIAVLYLGHSGRIYLWQPMTLLFCFALYVLSAVYGHWRKQKTELPEIPHTRDVNEIIVFESILDELDAETPGERILIIAKRYLAYQQRAEKGSLLGLLARFPVNAVLFLSIPPLGEDEDGEAEERVMTRFLNHYRSLVFPFGLCFLIIGITGLHGHKHGAALVAAALSAALLVSMVTLHFKKSWRHPPGEHLGYVVAGFVCSLFWIYVVTKELLNALTAIGTMSGIDDAILGLTILAWGNSCGDLVSNIALARNGGVETAVIAALSGPIQNVLLTLGVSFAMACFRSKERTIILDPPQTTFYLTGASLIACLCVLLILVPFVFRYRMTRLLGFGLLCAYCLYLVCGLKSVLSDKKINA